jgi:hypothetical protein
VNNSGEKSMLKRRRPSNRQGVFAEGARQRRRQRRRQELRRVFAQEEGEEEKVQPGGVSETLKRRMGDDIAEMFDDAGKELYKETVESLKLVLREQFERTIPELNQALTEEGGRRWTRDASEFYRPWINEMVEDGADKEELLEIPIEETEEVEEVEDEEEAEPAADEEEEADLEELLAAEFPRQKHYRRKPRRRPVFASDPVLEQQTKKKKSNSRRHGTGARQRSYVPRRQAQHALHFPDVLWEEIEYFIPDTWEALEELVTVNQDGSVEADDEVLGHLLEELKYIAEMRCGNENYSPQENTQVLDAVGGVLREAGHDVPEWMSECEVGRDVGHFDTESLDVEWY